mmetsp:Transcript_23189/g.43452  ORF Transcript_23189/g.43452 Transcript_23189/m.43452 type:complete len:152 (-) Transcript_23189:125-580(-)
MGKRRKNKKKGKETTQDGKMQTEGGGSAGVKALELSRGKIIQRHRQEYKKLRETLANMRRERQKHSKSNNAWKDSRKDIGKRMKQLQKEFDERCKRELEEFDKGKEMAESMSVSESKTVAGDDTGSDLSRVERMETGATGVSVMSTTSNVT